MRYNYPWPASALTAEDMALLYEARESSQRHVPITMLLAEAVRRSFTPDAPPQADAAMPSNQPQEQPR